MKRHIKQIEREYEQPFIEVLRGYATDGETLRSTAEILGISNRTQLESIAQAEGITFTRRAARRELSSDHRQAISRGRRRTARKYQWQGQRLTVCEIADKLDLPRGTVWSRIHRNKNDWQNRINEPVNRRNR